MTIVATCAMRRFSRLTNGFSKKLANHEAAVAPHFMHYDFCRKHQTLRVTPAMNAGVASHVWSLAELVGLLDAADKTAAQLGILLAGIWRIDACPESFERREPGVVVRLGRRALLLVERSS